MGVPNYYKQITEKYPKCIHMTKDMGGNIKLFFDFNGLIHTVVNNCEATDLADMRVLFFKIVQYFEYIVDYIKPVWIMVAIDGVCPRLKMIQQRLRRFKSAKERQQDSNFDRNGISPGTKFMQDLCEYLHNHFKQYDNLLFVDANEAGEGEHNIYNFIKEDKDCTKDTRYVIYGLDADLIMLSFISPKDNIYLLRERQAFDREYKEEGLNFNFLDINELKFGLIDDTKQRYEIDFDEREFLDDYVFFCFLLGNDFMPHINVLSIYHNGMDLLMANYVKMRKRMNMSLIYKGKINTAALSGLLKDIVRDEDKLVVQTSKKYSRGYQLNYNRRNWKKNYYYHFFNNYTEKYVNEICDNYWNTLVWTFKYYFEGCPSWKYNYEYRAAPCLSDLVNYLKQIDLNDYTFEKDEPYTQNQQLMMILPPRSIKLLPEKYRGLISNELVEFYPVDFKYETVDKMVNWQHEPIIPEINDKLIMKYVRD